jgi:hypothetical protein
MLLTMVWTSPSCDRKQEGISCDRLHGALGVQFAEFRDVRSSVLQILERTFFCQVRIFLLINYFVLGQYSLKGDALFENYLSSKIALVVQNKKNMCMKCIYFYYFR